MSRSTTPRPRRSRKGRKHLYDTHATSGLGHVSCASCHLDARMDRLAWDLGNPAGQMIPFDQNCNFGNPALGPGPCPDWHPMKGPVVTQTLQDIIGKEPHHWRGDRNGIEEFAQTFASLQGDDETPTPEEMAELEAFLATVTFPPNPFRVPLTNRLPTSMSLPGHYTTGLEGGAPAGQPLTNGFPEIGQVLFDEGSLVPGAVGVGCATCHTPQAGVGTNLYFQGNNGQPLPLGADGELHHTVVFSPVSETPSMSIKVPHLRNLHEKVGFEMTQITSRAGFGFLHDGSVDSLARIVGNPPFDPEGNDEVVADVVAFLLAFSGSNMGPGTDFDPSHPLGPLSRDTHSAAGMQITVNAANKNSPSTASTLTAWTSAIDGGPDGPPGPWIGLVAKGRRNGIPRGYVYLGNGQFQSDRAVEVQTTGACSRLRAPVARRRSRSCRTGPRSVSAWTATRTHTSTGTSSTHAAIPPIRQACREGTSELPRWSLAGRGVIRSCWEPLGATFDVVRGNLPALRASGGDFTAAIDACLADDLAVPALSYPDQPGPEDVFFLVRGACLQGGMTYDSDGPAQVDPRDDEINAAPAACAD